MAKTVKIPNVMNPYEVIINNRKYSYPAGKTMEVPDEVAAIIENRDALDIEPQGGTGGSGGGLFIINVSCSGEPEVFELGNKTITAYGMNSGEVIFDKTYAEIKTALNSGLLPIALLTIEDVNRFQYFVANLNWHEITEGNDLNTHFAFNCVSGDGGYTIYTTLCVRNNGRNDMTQTIITIQ